MEATHTRARALLAVAHVRRIGEALAGTGARIMPLKGALLHATVYDDPAERPLSDVDLLVDGDFDAVLDRLARDGYVLRRPLAGGAARDLTHKELGLRVDLHERLFPPLVFRLSREGVFARSTPDDALFGVRVQIPDPYDVYAHLVGHFAAGRLNRGDLTHLRDFAAVAKAHDLDPARCARRLAETGIARGARYALAMAVRDAGDDFAPRVLAALSPDPVGEALSRAVLATMGVLPTGSKLGVVPSGLLNTSLPRCAASLGLRGVRVAKLAVRYGAYPRHRGAEVTR